MLVGKSAVQLIFRDRVADQPLVMLDGFMLNVQVGAGISGTYHEHARLQAPGIVFELFFQLSHTSFSAVSNIPSQHREIS